MSPEPVESAPSTRTLVSSTSGASERMMPAQAVPCPFRSPPSSSSTEISSSWETTATERAMPPTSGCSRSIPESTTATRTPRPVAPSNAHSRVIPAGQAGARRSSAPDGRLQAGSSSFVSSAASAMAAIVVTPDGRETLLLRGIDREVRVRRLGGELVEPVLHDRVAHDVGVGLDEVRHPRDDLLHELAVEVGPALDALVSQERRAAVDVGVDAGHALGVALEPVQSGRLL